MTDPSAIKAGNPLQLDDVSASESTGRMTTGGRAARDSLAREEHLAAVLRFRKSLGMGLFVWPSFALLDLLVAKLYVPESTALLLGLRFLGWVAIIVVLITVVRVKDVSPRLFRILDIGLFTMATGAVSLMCTRFGGIASPYGFGVAVIMIARFATLSDHWKRSLVPLAVPTLVYPVTLLSSALFSPRIAAQLHDPRALGYFAINLSYVLGAYLMLLLGGHAIWALRRQVFAARNIGRYRLVRRIGAGGMGEVWAAKHHALKREVAVKILKPQVAGSVAIPRFEREVRATAELNHPNTVRVLDYGVTEDELWYYAMELLEGEDLQSIVKRDGPLPPARTLHFALHAARALAEAHGRGIVHRDIKPANLFVAFLGGEYDFIKVLDFGIARFAGGEGSTVLTAEGLVAGTPAYMSPEACAGEDADARADVYALGAVIYYMLCGEPPFVRSNPVAVLAAHRNEAVVPPSRKLGTPLPNDLEAVALRCLEKAPDKRYPSAKELVTALEACADAGKWSQAEAAKAFVAPRPAEEGALPEPANRPAPSMRPKEEVTLTVDVPAHSKQG